jgi:hypothetical protein
MNHIRMIICSIIVMLLFQNSIAQKYAYQKVNVYLLKSDYTSAKNEREAAYLLQMKNANDTTFICRYYNVYGPMIKQESFLDSTLSVPNGEFAWYNSRGAIDSEATVSRGKKISFASYADGKKIFTMRFRNGIVYEKRDYTQNLYTDSTGNTSDRKEKEKAEHEKFVVDSTASHAVPAKFGKEGKNQWQKYLEKHFLVPDRFLNVMRPGEYPVIISFLVTKEGKVSEVLLFSVGRIFSGHGGV